MDMGIKRYTNPLIKQQIELGQNLSSNAASMNVALANMYSKYFAQQSEQAYHAAQLKAAQYKTQANLQVRIAKMNLDNETKRLLMEQKMQADLLKKQLDIDLEVWKEQHQTERDLQKEQIQGEYRLEERRMQESGMDRRNQADNSRAIMVQSLQNKTELQKTGYTELNKFVKDQYDSGVPLNVALDRGMQIYGHLIGVDQRAIVSEPKSSAVRKSPTKEVDWATMLLGPTMGSIFNNFFSPKNVSEYSKASGVEVDPSMVSPKFQLDVQKTALDMEKTQLESQKLALEINREPWVLQGQLMTNLEKSAATLKHIQDLMGLPNISPEEKKTLTEVSKGIELNMLAARMYQGQIASNYFPQNPESSGPVVEGLTEQLPDEVRQPVISSAQNLARMFTYLHPIGMIANPIVDFQMNAHNYSSVNYKGRREDEAIRYLWQNKKLPGTLDQYTTLSEEEKARILEQFKDEPFPIEEGVTIGTFMQAAQSNDNSLKFGIAMQTGSNVVTSLVGRWAVGKVFGWLNKVPVINQATKYGEDFMMGKIGPDWLKQIMHYGQREVTLGGLKPSLAEESFSVSKIFHPDLKYQGKSLTIPQNPTPPSGYSAGIPRPQGNLRLPQGPYGSPKTGEYPLGPGFGPGLPTRPPPPVIQPPAPFSGGGSPLNYNASTLGIPPTPVPGLLGGTPPYTPKFNTPPVVAPPQVSGSQLPPVQMRMGAPNSSNIAPAVGAVPVSQGPITPPPPGIRPPILNQPPVPIAQQPVQGPVPPFPGIRPPSGLPMENLRGTLPPVIGPPGSQVSTPQEIPSPPTPPTYLKPTTSITQPGAMGKEEIKNAIRNKLQAQNQPPSVGEQLVEKQTKLGRPLKPEEVIETFPTTSQTSGTGKLSPAEFAKLTPQAQNYVRKTGSLQGYSEQSTATSKSWGISKENLSEKMKKDLSVEEMSKILDKRFDTREEVINFLKNNYSQYYMGYKPFKGHGWPAKKYETPTNLGPPKPQSSVGPNSQMAASLIPAVDDKLRGLVKDPNMLVSIRDEFSRQQPEVQARMLKFIEENLIV